MKTESKQEALRVTKALSDVQRLRILMLLQAGELCVCQIVAVLGLATSTVSKHLSLLEEAGLIAGRKEGRWAYYRWTSGAEAGFAAPVRAWAVRVLGEDADIKRDRQKLKQVSSCAPALLRKRQARKRSTRHV